MNSRIAYYDVLRGAAIIAVVAIHSFNYREAEVGKEISDWYFLYKVSLTFAVPIFIVLSGFFLSVGNLGNRTEYSLYCRKQLPRILIPYVIWVGFYTLYGFLHGVNLKIALFKMLTFQTVSPFYFIALIIQLYLLAPLAQKLADTRGLILSGILSFAFCILIYYLRNVMGVNPPIILYAGLFLPYLFFYVLGIYIRRGGMPIKHRFVSFALTLLFLGLAVVDSIVEFGQFADFNNATSAVKVSSFAYSFFLICFLFNSNNLRIEIGVLSYLGRFAFGIYFVHPFFLRIIPSFGEKHISFHSIVIQQVFIIVAVLFGSVLVAIIARRVSPGFASKYLGF